ncbi:MAG: hypothetical protein JO285_08230, partial [Kutzneria sp.]|nr:hypothetical protein [Kutzneria sp.]
MPSSLIIVALAVAWLVVLVPMVARRRQEVARTTDSALASRVVRGGNQEGFQSEDAEEDFDMDDVDEFGSRDAESVSVGYQEVEPDGGTRRYRPGRGGFDPEAAAVAARAKYAFRQRIVLLMLLVAVATGVTAGLVMSVLWWAHATVDLILVGYLMYLRRQVRIEEDIRERRQARLRHAVAEEYEETEYDETG